jgi:4'-phosphopantetheinyl transferase
MMHQMSVQDLPSSFPLRDRDAPSDGVRRARGAGVKVWLASPDAATHLDLARLSAPEKARLDAMTSPARRRDFLVSRALRQNVGGAASESLTHSGGHAALALAPETCRVGVDLERHRRRDALSLAEFAFSTEEHAWLSELDEENRIARFYSLWVMKEAMAKALQLPLLEALRRCTFVEDAPGQWHGSAPTEQPWQVRAFAREDWSLAVAWIGAASLPLEMLEWPSRRVADWAPMAAMQGS